MQDIKKNRRKVMNKQVEVVEPKVEENVVEELSEEDMLRGCNKHKNDKCENVDCGCNHGHHHDCGCHHEEDCEVYECICCKPKKEECEPCGVESDNCFDNKCGPKCCSPITPQKVSTANCVPYAIEANRVYDTMAFQVFTDATAPNGQTLTFDIEVVEVKGPVPRAGQANVVVEKVCVNSTGTVINTGVTSLEDYDIDPSSPMVGRNCETIFEYDVCGERNNECCKKGKGTCVSYKQRGLTVTVEDLVLELRGKCGCTKFVALAYPAVRTGTGCHKVRVDDVEFAYNTLSAPICLPSDGKAVVLRQEYQTNLTVDCIGKALLSYDEDDCEYELCIPNDIDLILCLQEIVSVLISEQIVVLGAQNPIDPRVVDTYSQICEFPKCGCEKQDKKDCKENKHCGC